MVAAMLQLQSSRRPGMPAVMAHPAWWSADRKLTFLVEISNFVEFQDRQVCISSSSETRWGAAAGCLVIKTIQRSCADSIRRLADAQV